MAGHDINYLAVAGPLAALGRFGENPTPPANILADFSGGGMICVLGILMALIEREKSGQGQVIDAAMIDGAAYLSTFVVKMNQSNLWNDSRGKNLLDTGAHFYETYKTKDGKFMAIGAIEPKFYRTLVTLLNLSATETLPTNNQFDKNQWPAMKLKFAKIFAQKTQAEWTALLTGTDACATPVLEWREVIRSQHYIDRWENRSNEGDKRSNVDFMKWSPPPAPILSRTPARRPDGFKSDPDIGEHTVEVLKEYGISIHQISSLQRDGVIGVAKEISQKSRL
ncbi:hypothetical protein HK100_012212 [Physocladia obscura]|uniref:Alpha-methylacyl-CoA racemase n=1 Tax=Physocladia obscura TaxID=109957 RepID=A0AAD5XHS2_9FUNG|nr:hypothetical protein HK100_012212 [Physocladia obscura]